MQQVWFTIEALKGGFWNNEDNLFAKVEDDATEFDEYSDAALVAQGLGNCAVIKHWRVGLGVEHTEVAGEF